MLQWNESCFDTLWVKEYMMKKNLFKLVWFVFPLTKLVYVFLAYSQHKEINNAFELTSILLMGIGIIACAVSIFLSKKIYKKSFLENKTVSMLAGSRASDNESKTFALFTMLLGLAESAAVFGFVQYIITGNLIAGLILLVFCLVAWLFNYPSSQESEEE